MKPVQVGGVTVTNATLHNQSEIDRKDVRITDHVIIQRAGDVIPEIVQVLLDKRKSSSKKFLLPDKCPICKSKAEKPEEEVVLRCVNPVCPARLKESLKHFISRRAMNVERLGDRMIETLVDHEFIKSFSDIYKLTYDQMISLDRQGEKSVQNILDSIEKSRNTTLDRLIFALGIRHVGEQTAKDIVHHFHDLESILSASEEDFLKVEGIGPRVAQSLHSTLAQKSVIKEINELLKSGVKFGNVKKVKGALSGQTFVITGTLPVPRPEVQDLIEKAGGRCASSVSKKTNYLIAGEEAGSKLEKAREFGVKILSWEELQNLIE
jgi:DNA ligase (NAD+)